MFLPKFELLPAGSFNEAVELLHAHGSSAKLVAGGSDLFPRMKYRLITPKVVISLKRTPVRDLAIASDGSLTLDALERLAHIAHDSRIRDAAPLLSEAALAVGSNQIRHMATLGGNLCLDTRCLYYNQSHRYQFVEPCFKRNGQRCYLVPKGRRCWAVFMGDTVPALLCLGATIEIASLEHPKTIKTEDLYTGDPISPIALSRTEIIQSVTVPGVSGPQGSAFVKHTMRGGLEFAIVNVATLMNMAEDCETCVDARIAVGAVSAVPARLKKAEAVLVGNRISDDLFHAAAETAAMEITPVMHHGFSVAYLRKCVEVCAKDALTLASQRIARRWHSTS
jgi:4-hydroxybenzoyl-CoA reductase beta subunit